jgi:chemotaxis protein CheX
MLFNGVRMAVATPPAETSSPTEEERRMPVSLRESLHEVAEPGNLDASVEEVFRLMLGLECKRDPGSVEPAQDSVTAVVGFGGLLSGACVLSTGRQVALEIAAHMTGMQFEEVDDTVKDGIGEICNMLAGAWKGKVPALAAHCGLSVPAVITGRDYRLHVQAPEFQLHHRYRFGDSQFSVTIVCDGLQ